MTNLNVAVGLVTTYQYALTRNNNGGTLLQQQQQKNVNCSFYPVAILVLTLHSKVLGQIFFLLVSSSEMRGEASALMFVVCVHTKDEDEGGGV